MIKFNVKIADEVFRIHCRYGFVKDFFEDYMTDEPTDTVIEATLEECDRAAAELKQNALARGDMSYKHYDNVAENSAIFRLITSALLKRGVLMIHGSAIIADGQASLFTARSGTGKSTHTRLWCELLGSRARILNDDKPFIRPTGNGAIAYGSPWSGNENPGKNTSAPLKAIIKLSRGNENIIRPAAVSEMVPELFAATFQRDCVADKALSLALQTRLLSSVKLYSLQCDISPEAARICYEAVSR